MINIKKVTIIKLLISKEKLFNASNCHRNNEKFNIIHHYLRQAIYMINHSFIKSLKNIFQKTQKKEDFTRNY